MALKAILDSLTDIPEALHGEYVERNGKFELQVEGMKTQGDVDRLQTALTKERNNHDDNNQFNNCKAGSPPRFHLIIVAF